jgi:hypothetical protein
MRTSRTLEAEWRQVLRGSVSRGAKEDESSTGRVYGAGFHHVTALSRLARVLKLMSRLIIWFLISFSGRGNSRITETSGTELVDTGAHLYYNLYFRKFSKPLPRYISAVSGKELNDSHSNHLRGQHNTQKCAPQGYYTASSGHFLATFRNNLSVPASGFRTQKMGPFLDTWILVAKIAFHTVLSESRCALINGVGFVFHEP